MKVKCPKCEYEWEYKGNSEWFISCARCKHNISVKKLKTENAKENE